MRRFAVCLLLMITVLTACHSGPSVENGVDTDARLQNVLFTDALGREVSIPGNPERVAALLGSYADLWMLAGGEVCATADDAWDDFDLELGEEVINLGNTKSPNLELLLASDPDLVLASASTAADVEMLDTLESAGILVVYLEVNCFEEYLEALEFCTELTGCGDLYEEYGAKVQEQIQAAVEGYATGEATAQDDATQGDAAQDDATQGNAPQGDATQGNAAQSDGEPNEGAKDAPKVLFLRASAGYIRAKNSEGSILGEMLAELGCVNIADSDAMLLENLSIESILKQDPDHIFIVQSGDDPEGTVENVNKMMEENPAWKDLTAVKEGRVHYMDKHLFNLKPNARWAEAYEQLIEILQE